MRIGIFTDTYPPYINGVSTSIAMLEKGLKALGHEVYIVTVNPENMQYKYENDAHIIRIPGIPIGIYDYRLTGIYPLRAINKIKKWNLDIIHSHTEFGVGTFARIVAKQYNIPLVHTYHTMYEDYVYYITKGYFDRSSKKVVEYLTKFYCDKTARELIVPSKKTYNMFKEKYKFDKDIHIVPTGIDIDRFKKEKIDKKELEKLKKELGIKKEDFVILFVGRIAKEKNIDLLLNCHGKILKKHKNVKLVIVGSGPDYEHYIDMSKKLKINNNVIFTSSIPWEDIPIYYGLADVFTTASNTETQGLTLIEAMAGSIPVVCLKDKSFEDILIDDKNGKYFTDEKEYIDNMIYLIENPDIRKSMCEQARITSEMHSIEFFAKSILEVYKIATQSNKKTIIDKIKDKFKKDKDE
jgi:1,2-diacylglycerol 3-alpha-glucosyltransferase